MLKGSKFTRNTDQLKADTVRAGVLTPVPSTPTLEQLAEQSKKDYRNLIKSIYE